MAASISSMSVPLARAWRFSRRSRRAVSGVRSWWERVGDEDPLGGEHFGETGGHRRHRLGERLQLDGSVEWLFVDGEVAAGEPGDDALQPADRASHGPGDRQSDKVIAARMTAATAARASQNRWIWLSTSSVSSVTRTAPWTVPPDATGIATYSKSVFSVADERVPIAA